MKVPQELLDAQGWALLERKLDALACEALRNGQIPPWVAALREPLEPLARRWLAHSGAASGQARANQPCLQVQTLTAGQGQPLAASHAPDCFPLQVFILLSAPGRDFTAGHAIAVEQRPRMQSRPTVLPLEQGSIALCATGPRPLQGHRGPYNTLLRLGIGSVRSGERLSCVLRWRI
ncbi:2OG-Fe(II) oxygenase [Bordetella holmesii]|uniref:2OG-Fe(II) oxygenase n=1 Tax=Bordetella holmesii TaxID=35814 RepID=UPI0012985BA2|nr:2OG-Fe(II) oxygenase [Bordetella holmesii]QGD46956.1 2OG-Fe(II) oxygenase [Bordetella holmesii]